MGAGGIVSVVMHVYINFDVCWWIGSATLRHGVLALIDYDFTLIGCLRSIVSGLREDVYQRVGFNHNVLTWDLSAN
jgi:hypothetical protein